MARRTTKRTPGKEAKHIVARLARHDAETSDFDTLRIVLAMIAMGAMSRERAVSAAALARETGIGRDTVDFIVSEIFMPGIAVLSHRPVRRDLNWDSPHYWIETRGERVKWYAAGLAREALKLARQAKSVGRIGDAMSRGVHLSMVEESPSVETQACAG